MTIRSSIYLSGNKFKLVENIVPHLKEEGRSILVEPFVGTGVMSLHCLEQNIFPKSYCNDLADWIVELHNSLKDPKFILEVSKINTQYKSDEEGFYKLRRAYNKGGCKDPAKLFCLMLRGNSNRVRFSGRGETLKHNIPWGKRNPFNMERMLRHHTLSQNMEVSQGNYVVFLHNLNKTLDWKDVVIYLDPPYATGGKSGGAVYNIGWEDTDDDILLQCVDKYSKLGAKVVLSNIFFNKGFTFNKLINFCEERADRFEVFHLDQDYRNSAHVKYEGKKTDEVLIVSK